MLVAMLMVWQKDVKPNPLCTSTIEATESTTNYPTTTTDPKNGTCISNGNLGRLSLT